MSFSPFLKSSSMFSICVPAFLRWELHQAVKVYDHKRMLNLLHVSTNLTLLTFDLRRSFRHGGQLDKPSFQLI